MIAMERRRSTHLLAWSSAGCPCPNQIHNSTVRFSAWWFWLIDRVDLIHPIQDTSYKKGKVGSLCMQHFCEHGHHLTLQLLLHFHSKQPGISSAYSSRSGCAYSQADLGDTACGHGKQSSGLGGGSIRWAVCCGMTCVCLLGRAEDWLGMFVCVWACGWGRWWGFDLQCSINLVFQWLGFVYGMLGMPVLYGVFCSPCNGCKVCEMLLLWV